MTEIAYKLTLLLTAREGHSADALADAWLELESRRPLEHPGLVGHLVGRGLAGPSPIAGAPSAPYDAVVETWWARKNDAADWIASREFTDGWLPERLTLLGGVPAALGGIPQLVWSRDAETAGAEVRVLVLPVARGRLRFEQFVEHWTGAHAQLALSGPGAIERLRSIEVTPAPMAPPSRFRRTRFHGVGAIEFVSADALAAEFASDHYREHLVPDEPRFTDPAASAAILTRPVRLR